VEENQPVPNRGNIISAMFLVAGTCIGGGMLALPVATGINGFIPSMVMMVICWIAMTVSALLLLEVSLWMEEGVHVITMTSRLLGPVGKIVSWVLYLFICYASIVAYTAAAGAQISFAAETYLGMNLSKHVGALLFVLIFGAIIDLGSQVVGRVNSILFMGMIVAYFALVATSVGEIKPSFLLHQHWPTSLMAIPLLLTSFSFQTMVPSLTPYLKRHAKALRLAVIGGTSIAFVMYAVWEMIILGIVPVSGGPNCLIEAFFRGEPATIFIQSHVQGQWITRIAEFFAFFAIVTSFLGMTLGLFDFLSDGLKIKKTGFGRILLGLLIIVPTMIFATNFERVFLVALDTSGGFGDTILNGMIPVLMVWVGRYWMGYENGFRLPGGKPLLIVIFCFFLFALILEILVLSGFITFTPTVC
jgi:tyrosine-specific transport protein